MDLLTECYFRNIYEEKAGKKASWTPSPGTDEIKSGS